MAPPAPRSKQRRKADTLAKLTEQYADVWVSTAGSSGTGSPQPYLVPLSLAWIDERVVIALDANSRTARNIAAQGVARLALGPTRDVVVIEAVLDHAVAVAEAPHDIAERYAAQADWDPRESAEGTEYMVLTPHRIQAWREANELADRTLMRDGRWLV